MIQPALTKSRAVTTAATALIASAALVLASCSTDGANEAGGTSEANNASEVATAGESAAADSSSESTAEAVTLKDGVVRAKGKDKDMTAIFGTLENHTDADIELKGFETDLDAKMNQVHEVVDGQMREVKEPLVIPAQGSVELKPGGHHLMLMGIKDEIKAGDKVQLTLELGDGSKVEVVDVAVRSMGAGDESYGDIEGEHAGHGGHSDHGGADASHSEHTKH